MYFFYNAPPRNPSSKFIGRDLRLVLARTLEQKKKYLMNKIFKLSLNQKTSQEMSEEDTKAPKYISWCSVSGFVLDLASPVVIAYSRGSESAHAQWSLSTEPKEQSGLGRHQTWLFTIPGPPSCYFTIQLSLCEKWLDRMRTLNLLVNVFMKHGNYRSTKVSFY